jgi:hypothetical protein
MIDAAGIEHRLIVRPRESDGHPRTYCGCGWASTHGVSFGNMEAESFDHLGIARDQTPRVVLPTKPLRDEPVTLF